MRLSGKRYNSIEEAVVKLFSELNISRIPVDPYEIVDALGIKLVTYSQFTQLSYEQKMLISKDGFCEEIAISPTESYFVIVYNEMMPDVRIRFTIMHEIGHIILDHSEHSELADSEANYFASYSLAPPPLIHKINPEDFTDIAETFDISMECAMYAMKKYNNWLRYGSKDFLNHEIQLLKLFKLVV